MEVVPPATRIPEPIPPSERRPIAFQNSTPNTNAMTVPAPGPLPGRGAITNNIKNKAPYLLNFSECLCLVFANSLVSKLFIMVECFIMKFEIGPRTANPSIA